MADVPGSVGGHNDRRGRRNSATKFMDARLGQGRFIVKEKLGGGSFGDIYTGIDTLRKCDVAIKIEQKKARHPQLAYEHKIYKILNTVPPSSGEDYFGAVGIPNVYYYGVEGDFNVLIIDLLGPSLEDLFNYCGRRFSLKTTCMLAEQMLHRLEYVHSRHLLHRDLKPENFVMGILDKAHHVYLIDYGLSKKYWDIRINQHIPYKEGKPLTGTARYCSINTHLGIEQSRRDDMEGVGFILLYFIKGSLPWQGLRGDNNQKTWRIGEKKMNIGMETLCRDEPPAFLRYMKYCRALDFEETPKYEWCRSLFRDLLERERLRRDWVFDWVERRRQERHAEIHESYAIQGTQGSVDFNTQAESNNIDTHTESSNITLLEGAKYER